MLLFSLIAYAVIGIGSGLLAGLLGMSGGIITVPCLLFVFTWLGFPAEELMQLAIGTSLAAMVFNALSSTYSHNKSGAINWKLVKKMVPGLIIGCILGAYLGHILPNRILQLIFACFAIVLGFFFFRHKELPDVGKYKLPSRPILNSYGFGIGALSNVLGIGGGTMTVPLFVAFKLPLKASVATSAATGFIITLAGAVSYLIFGLGEAYYSYTFGYIYLPAFVILAIATFVAAPYGARMAHRMETDKLKKIFALSLLFVGIAMVFL
jgi:uncharacterized membrane protein YfcA